MRKREEERPKVSFYLCLIKSPVHISYHDLRTHVSREINDRQRLLIKKKEFERNILPKNYIYNNISLRLTLSFPVITWNTCWLWMRPATLYIMIIQMATCYVRSWQHLGHIWRPTLIVCAELYHVERLDLYNTKYVLLPPFSLISVSFILCKFLLVRISFFLHILLHPQLNNTCAVWNSCILVGKWSRRAR